MITPLSLALAVFIAPAWAIPVDLRTLESSPNRAAATAVESPLPVNEGPYYPGCEVLASREVLNELLAIAESLRSEAWNLDSDVAELWTQWRAFVPASLGMTPGASVAMGQLQLSSGAEEARQSEVFNLHQAARLVATRTQALMKALEKAESDWWRNWRALDAAADARRSGAELKPRLDKFKERLQALAQDSNALDAGIRQAQSQYDFVRPLMLDHLANRRAAQPMLRQPWHWNYVMTGQPRPDRSYDFRERYDSHYDNSHAILRTRRRLE